MKKSGLVVLALVFVIAAAFLTGCGKEAKKETKDSGKLKVVATIFPEYDFLRQIGGDKIDLSMLVPPGSETHSFEPTPKDIKKVNEAKFFVYVGGDSDEWVSKILKSVDNKKQKTVKLMDMVKTVEEKTVKGMTEGKHEHNHDKDKAGKKEEKHHDDDEKKHKKKEEEHDHHEGEEADKKQEHNHEGGAEQDEHVWTSPKNAVKIVNKLAKQLGELDKDNKDYYADNARAYIKKLKKLDSQFENVVKRGKRKEIIVGDRFPFRYFADAYKLKYYAAFPGCSNDTEASAETIAFLTKRVKKDKIPVVFHIELSNEKVCKSICEATGAKKRQLNAVHNVTKKDFESGVAYMDLMNRNLEVMKEALN